MASPGTPAVRRTPSDDDRHRALAVFSALPTVVMSVPDSEAWPGGRVTSISNVPFATEAPVTS
ncbi:hypothetical protein [Streptomyces sp. NPDC057257]|uniref:hypothetical protein n=1 Tax=Streptomyces sp. NPDC057257 TaxID=3346071 RepID=UPI0036404869